MTTEKMVNHIRGNLHAACAQQDARCLVCARLRCHLLFQTSSDLSLPITHLLGVATLGKCFEQRSAFYPKCCNRIRHTHATVLGVNGLDLHHNVRRVRRRSYLNVFRTVRLKVDIYDGPDSLLPTVSLSEHGVA